MRALTKRARHHGLADLLGRLNPVLRGWCAYFRHGVSKATFGYLDAFVWHRVTQWLLKRHKRITWAALCRNRAKELRDGIAAMTELSPQLRKTLTWHEGMEMALHQQISAETGLDVYFCDAHSPWQRGSK